MPYYYNNFSIRVKTLFSVAMDLTITKIEIILFGQLNNQTKAVMKKVRKDSEFTENRDLLRSGFSRIAMDYHF